MAARKPTSPLQVFWGLLCLVVLVGLGLALLLRLIDQAKELSPDVVATIIAGVFTVGGLVWSRRQERAQAIALELRNQKAPIYTEFMDFWFQVFLNPKVGKPAPIEQQMAQFFATSTKDMITWGSDDVLVKYAALKNADGSKPAKTMDHFAQLLLAIRRDLGHRNKNVGPDDVLSLFINDWAEYRAKNSSPDV